MKNLHGHPLLLSLFTAYAASFLLSPTLLTAQVCSSGPGVLASYTPGSSTDEREQNCIAAPGFRCYEPVPLGAGYEITSPGCDPLLGPCGVRASVGLQFPGNRQTNDEFPFPLPDSTVKLRWLQGGQQVAACGGPGLLIREDDGIATLEAGVSCADVLLNPAAFVFTLQVITCSAIPNCRKEATTAVNLGAGAGCPVPPPLDSCEEEESCRECGGPGGGMKRGGGGGSGAPANSGPGAMLRYRAGGAGHPGYPGSAAWRVALGQYWAHDYAERIVVDPDPSHVWLITKHAVFREFTDDNSDGLYETVAPSDEYRRLEKTTAGWELRSLDGTVQHFDNNGRWSQSVDRNQNAKVATYSGSTLSAVSFPDGRSETFTYHPSGKLATITEVGVDGTTSRTWTYTWNGDDLERIDRPDGTAIALNYDDMRYPGYLTRMTLVGTDASERILLGRAYDEHGNAVLDWRGSADPDSPEAVEKWAFGFDDPFTPTRNIVIDPLGNTSTYEIERDPNSRKPRIAEIEGDCPTCGLGPNTQLFYEDVANPLRVTREISGDGVTTLYAYDLDGQLISRTEAMGTALERSTEYDYHPLFPALVTRIDQPSTSGVAFDLRRTVIDRDAFGNPNERTIEGVEDGQPFSYTTETTYTAEGQPEIIDPPGYAAVDQTAYLYDPARGNLLPSSRTDPLIGTTTFAYDPFNRRTGVTDPNNVTATTAYDALNRPRFITQEGATPAEDLVTEHVYNVFGDLFQTILPEGNVIEYGYDHAGRLISIERKPDTASTSHGERTFYTLDAFGHRIREERQSWDGNAWITAATTAFEYSTRCHLDRVIEGAGLAAQSVTEYAYDCDGNLERIWDANHPSNGQTEPASTVYAYDDLDRLTTVTQPWGGGAGSIVTTYGYDVQDHLTTVTDAEANVTTYVYSDRDLMTQESSQTTGLTTYLYNEHGELTVRTDARGVTMTRTIDALDRVTFESYPDNSLDVTYTYDDPLVPFSQGRLTRIARHGEAVDYTYDRFGRTTQDGALAYDYDANGNRTAITYPGNVIATSTYDYADRQQTLIVDVPGQPSAAIVTASGYYPSGPLQTLDLGNGLSETRTYDSRYHPARITLAGASTLLDWQYTTEPVGNITLIEDLLAPGAERTYDYQDYQYFLTQGDGPWGTRAWAYDPIGNRLSETRDGGPADVYQYEPNPAAGHSPKLDLIQLGAGGTRDYAYDAAGNQIQVITSAGSTEMRYDDASRLSTLENLTHDARTDFLYDGRSFLQDAAASDTSEIFSDDFESGGLACWSVIVGGAMGGSCPPRPATKPTYSSEGLLHHIERENGATSRYVFYHAGTPVATLELAGGVSGSLLFLTADHLGTPVLASSDTGQVSWAGGLEPFGGDYADAEGQGVFLRFPGQWVDGAWSASSVDTGAYYNVHRWYEHGRGRYARPDPLGLEAGDPNIYLYAGGVPSVLVDPMGLAVQVDPALQPFVDCAQQVPFFDMAWQWFVENGDWTVKPIDSFPGPILRHGQTLPLDDNQGLPNCKKGGRIFPDDRTGLLPRGGSAACNMVVEALAHEVVETWAYCSLGMSNRAAHTFTQRGPVDHPNGLDDDIAKIGCSTCECQTGLP